MASDFNKPVVGDAYASLLPALVVTLKDLARSLEPTLTGTSTNLPTGTTRWNAASAYWERFNGSAWVTLPSAGTNLYAFNISGNSATATSAGSATTAGSATNVTGLVGVPNGGTGLTTITSGGLLVGNGTSAAGVASAAQIVAAISTTAVANATNATSSRAVTNSGGWGVVPSGSKLYFSFNGTNLGSLDSSGNFIAYGNITAYGTP
jgi:hypothetical protein